MAENPGNLPLPSATAPSNDDRLADFADRVMATANPTEVGQIPVDPELRELEEMVIFLKKGLAVPQPAEVERIRSHLLAELPPPAVMDLPAKVKSSGKSPLVSRKKNWLERLLYPAARLPARKFALGFAIVAALVLTGVVLFSPLVSPQVTATALGDNLTPLFLAGLLLAMIAGYMIYRSRR